MRVLAIGGTGFIGRFAVEALADAGHETIVFHRGSAPQGAAARSITGDRRNLAEHAAELRALAADVVIDFLLATGRQAEQLVEVFRGHTGRIVMLSSCDVYRAAGILHGTEPGEPDNSPITEDSALRNHLHPYPPDAVRKLRAVFPWLEDDYDKIPAERAILSGAVPGTVLRLPMIYGPGDPLHRFYPVIREAEAGRATIAIEQGVAEWRGIRGYVEDVAWAVALAAMDDRAAGRVYNVGDPENFTELEWRRRIAQAAGWAGEFVVTPGETPRQHWVVDGSRIRRELGYRERVDREEALRRTIAWERAHPPAGGAG